MINVNAYSGDKNHAMLFPPKIEVRLGKLWYSQLSMYISETFDDYLFLLLKISVYESPMPMIFCGFFFILYLIAICVIGTALFWWCQLLTRFAMEL